MNLRDIIHSKKNKTGIERNKMNMHIDNNRIEDSKQADTS